MSGYDDGPIPADVWRQALERGPRGMAYMDMPDDVTLTLWLPGDPPACDCPLDPHHRWNCPLTPIWAQTMRDLDCNPWTVFRPRDLRISTRFSPFSWDGLRGTHCGRGPCCLGDRHDGRCRM